MSKLPDILTELSNVDMEAGTQVIILAGGHGWNTAEQSEAPALCPEKLQRWCWQSDYLDRKHLVIFLSLNKRFTKALRALSTFQSSNTDQPGISKPTEMCVENWSERFKLYRKTRSIFHKLLKSMNLRREQLMNHDPFDGDFVEKINADIITIRELDNTWYNGVTVRGYTGCKVIRCLDDIPCIWAHDADYAVRFMLSKGSMMSNILLPRPTEDKVEDDILKDLDIPVPEFSAVEPSPSSTASLSTFISGKHFNVCYSS